jgi:cytochrome c-type biogenesis protein CcmH
MTRLRLLIGLVMLLPVVAAATVPDAQRDRYQALLHELRCVVCQNQSIAESDAPLAEDLRQQVATQIRDGRSNAEIRSYLTDRYGDFVLYNPPLKRSTWLLWFGPFALLLIAVAGVGWRLWRRPVSSDAPSSEQTQGTTVNDLLRRYPEHRE